jgi:hypothetical protein
MTAATAACFVAASGLRSRSATLALAAGGCYTTMLAITLGGNMPINLRVFRWDEDDGDTGMGADRADAGTESTASESRST